MEWLMWFRKEIDSLDNEIIELLSKRFKVVKKVWEYKKDNSIVPLQPWRWNEVLLSKKKHADKVWIDSKFIEKIWNLIHEHALDLEKNV